MSDWLEHLDYLDGTEDEQDSPDDWAREITWAMYQLTEAEWLDSLAVR